MRTFYKLSLTLLLLFFFVFLFKNAASEFLRLAPCDYLDNVADGTARLVPRTLASVREKLLLAQRFDEKNPTIAEYVALTSYYRATLSGFDVSLQRAFFKQALDEYQEALLLRPNSGYLWAAVLQTQDAIVETEQAIAKKKLLPFILPSEYVLIIREAFKHASQLSPWDVSVLAVTTKIGEKYQQSFNQAEHILLEQAKQQYTKLQPVKAK